MENGKRKHSNIILYYIILYYIMLIGWISVICFTHGILYYIFYFLFSIFYFLFSRFYFLDSIFYFLYSMDEWVNGWGIVNVNVNVDREFAAAEKFEAGG